MIIDWFIEAQGKRFSATGEYFSGEPPDSPLTEILGIETRDMKEFARYMLSQAELPGSLDSALTNLCRGLKAYTQFQDILGLTFDVIKAEEGTSRVDASTIFNRHYCYYESLNYIREGAVSWLDRNVLATMTLLRPFMELAVLHLYWYCHCEQTSYQVYYDWLRDGKDKLKPGFKSALRDVCDLLPSKGFVDEDLLGSVRDELQSMYTTLCAYNHSPRLDESTAAMAGGLGNIGYESFLYALHVTNLLLRRIVLLYALSYPMSLFPVDAYKKWAFSGPVGTYFDPCNFAILQAYLGVESVTALKDGLSSVPLVRNCLEYYDKAPAKTDEEIEADWKRSEAQTGNPIKAEHIGQKLAAHKAHFRAVGWSMNYALEVPPIDVILYS